MHQRREHISKSLVSRHDLRLEIVTTWTGAHDECHCRRGSSHTHTGHLQALAHRNISQALCPTSLDKVSWNPGSSFHHNLSGKDSHQMEGVWNEEKVWETKGLRDLSWPHLRAATERKGINCSHSHNRN